MAALAFRFDDGGREAAGFRGRAGDCVARSIAIASGLPYREVYDALAAGAGSERKSKGRSARNGIHTSRKWFKDYMQRVGFVWTPTMRIGSGCTVHLAAGEVPMAGRHVVSVSKHYTALVEGVLHDTSDPQREVHTVYTVSADTEPKRGWRYLRDHPGDMRQYASIERRCVYGYWTFTGASA